MGDVSGDDDGVVVLEVLAEHWNAGVAPYPRRLIEWERQTLLGRPVQSFEALLILWGVPYRRGPGYAVDGGASGVAC